MKTNFASSLPSWKEKIKRTSYQFSAYRVSSMGATLFTYIMLIALSVIFLVPFIYMIGHSLMSVEDFINSNIKWLPRTLQFDNYAYAIRALNYWPNLVKSLAITLLSVVAQVFMCSFVGYGLARMNFKGKGIIFGTVLFSLIVPPQVILIPQYYLFSHMHMMNTYWPMIIPCFFSMGLNGGLFIYIFRQFYKGMPVELENAALIDGTGSFGAYFRIMFPNATSSILVTAILSMVWQWNNYFEPSVYIQNAADGTLTLQLSRLSEMASNNGAVTINGGISMAATFLVVLPILLIFFLIQRQFMQSIETSGLAN